MFSELDPRGVPYAKMLMVGRCRHCRKGLRVSAQPGVMVRAGGVVTRYAFKINGEVVLGVVINSHSDGTSIPCPACLPAVRRMRLMPVRGVYNANKKCSARCMSATGPSCECACGGANHGGGHHVGGE